MMSSVAYFLALALVVGQAETPASEQPNVFELPRLQARLDGLQVQLQTALQSRKFADAEGLCREMIKLAPHEPLPHYNLACTLARQQLPDAANAALAEAVARGFNDVKHLEADADLAPLRDRDDFKKLLEKAANAKPDQQTGWKHTVEPASIENNIGLVSEKNTSWDRRSGMLAALFRFGPATAEQPVVKGFGEAGDQLRKWFAEGTAAGNHGDLYDNHDTDHSNMDYDSFTQLARIEFDPAAIKRHLHHGLQLSFLYTAPTIGNSSTAMVNGPYWRSQARNALTQARGPQCLYLQYTNNQLYFYPEHRDHDPGHNGASDGYGDVLPANTPYMLISQGSSGSDRALMHAAALIMAALRPEVKAELIKNRTLMPAVQMIFRAGYKPVEVPEDYLTSKAHPTVFDGDKLDLLRLVNLAHELTLNALPPLAHITMVEEDEPRLGIDYFDSPAREKLFDTPAVIARVLKSSQLERRFVLSASDSRDPQQQPLKYHWVVLRGDADRIAVKPMSDDRSKMEIRVKHHERQPIEAGSPMESNRVDIALIVQNEKHYSAPAFLSLNYLDNEKRAYDESGRIKSVDYADPEMSKNYVDPMLDFAKDWRDEYHYNAAGDRTGWTRIRGEQREEFTAEGKLIVKTDEAGQPTETKSVRYVATQNRNEVDRLEQVAE